TAASFGIFFFFLFWALTSNFFISIGTILGERLLYLPSAGACLAIASGIVAVGKHIQPRWSPGGKTSNGDVPAALTPLSAALAAAVVLLAGARTWARNPDWKDNVSLYKSAALASPRSFKALGSYASELSAEGHAREAMSWAERALSIYP